MAKIFDSLFNNKKEQIEEQSDVSLIPLEEGIEDTTNRASGVHKTLDDQIIDAINQQENIEGFKKKISRLFDSKDIKNSNSLIDFRINEKKELSEDLILFEIIFYVKASSTQKIKWGIYDQENEIIYCTPFYESYKIINDDLIILLLYNGIVCYNYKSKEFLFKNTRNEIIYVNHLSSLIIKNNLNQNILILDIISNYMSKLSCYILIYNFETKKIDSIDYETKLISDKENLIVLYGDKIVNVKFLEEKQRAFKMSEHYESFIIKKQFGTDKSKFLTFYSQEEPVKLCIYDSQTNEISKKKIVNYECKKPTDIFDETQLKKIKENIKKQKERKLNLNNKGQIIEAQELFDYFLESREEFINVLKQTNVKTYSSIREQFQLNTSIIFFPECNIVLDERKMYFLEDYEREMENFIEYSERKNQYKNMISDFYEIRKQFQPKGIDKK